MEFTDFMNGVMHLDMDFTKCSKCGGTGFVDVMCCPGYDECGCYGKPIDFKHCDCGIEPASNEKILEKAREIERK